MGKSKKHAPSREQNLDVYDSMDARAGDSKMSQSYRDAVLPDEIKVLIASRQAKLAAE